jgi:hypothetical protein
MSARTGEGTGGGAATFSDPPQAAATWSLAEQEKGERRMEARVEGEAASA